MGIVRDEQRAIGSDCYADHASVDFLAGGIGNKSREEGFRFTGRDAILERNEDDLVAAANGAIPGTVFGNEGAVGIGCGELRAFIKNKLKRSDMSAEKKVGRDGFCDHVGS